MDPRTWSCSRRSCLDDLGGEPASALVRQEQEELRRLQDLLDDKEERADEVVEILGALTLSGDRSEELATWLVLGSRGIGARVGGKSSQFVIDALHPMIGLVVR